MKKGRMELVFILDRSGSMGGLESDTIGGFNSMLEKQRNGEGEVIVTTVLFDHEVELLHDRLPIAGVAPMTEKQYFVRGCTALLDAVGYAIHKIGTAQKNTVEAERAESVLFVITTDGMENASRHCSADDIRKKIERQKERYGWEFLFLGANMDAVSEAKKIGISEDRAVRYKCDSAGVQLHNAVVADAILSVRQCRPLGAEWKAEIEADYARRG